MLPRVEVTSTDVKSIMYDEVTNRMEVVYVRSGPYTYFNVKMEFYLEFLNAPSKGKFVNNILRKREDIPYQQGPIEQSELSLIPFFED